MIERVRLPPRARKSVSLRTALTDPGLLGGILGDDSWKAWRTLLIAAMGERLDDDERKLFRRLTRRNREPGVRVEEFVAIVGRRGGKSRAISVLGAFIAGLVDHRAVLAPGERGVVLLIAPDQRQAKIVLDYCHAAFDQSPILRQLIANRTQDTLSLTNSVDIEVRSASFRRLRGPTYLAVVADEASFYYLADDSSANSDTEILNAVRPGLSTTNGLLAIISSPHAKKGEVFEAYRLNFGADGDPLVLVAKGASREFNPTLLQSVVDRALARDHAAASAEFLGNFRDDLETFVNREQVESCIERGVSERPPARRIRYFSFCDPSGGFNDAMVIGIGHMEGKLLVIDGMRERKAPFDPENVVDEFASFLASYGIKQTTGDRYAGQWCVQSFAKRGIRYVHTDMNKSRLYVEMLPRLNAKTIRLLDHPRAVNQICQLERRTGRGQRGDIIDHPVRGHDDLANVIAGLCGVNAKSSNYDIAGFFGANPAEEDAQWRASQRTNHIFAAGGFRRLW